MVTSDFDRYDPYRLLWVRYGVWRCALGSV
jgi:hypothetical protein